MSVLEIISMLIRLFVPLLAFALGRHIERSRNDISQRPEDKVVVSPEMWMEIKKYEIDSERKLGEYRWTHVYAMGDEEKDGDHATD